MRIRLHKSRTVTSSLLAGILIIGSVSVAAPNILRALNNNSAAQGQGNSQGQGKSQGQNGTGPGQSNDYPGQSLDGNHGDSCVHSRATIINGNGDKGNNGNGEAADCLILTTLTINDPGP